MAAAAPDDLRLVRAVLEGDEDRAAALVERIQPLVQRIVRSHLPWRTDEADLIQMVYLRVFTKLEQYSGRAPLEHWVARLAVNTCRNQLRHHQRRPELRRADLSREQDELLDTLVATDTELTASTQVAARELTEALMARLSPPERMAVNLIHLQGHTLEEVRRLTGSSVTALKLRAFRARQKMKKALKHLSGESRASNLKSERKGKESCNYYGVR